MLDLISNASRIEPVGLTKIDYKKVEPGFSFTVEFVSKGQQISTNTVLRPKSILWPQDQFQAYQEILQLDRDLSNESFIGRPVEWLLKNNLTREPRCPACSNYMKTVYSHDHVIWNCKAASCGKFASSVLRPPVLKEFHHLPIDKLMFIIYYWASSISFELALKLLDIEPETLKTAWKKLQITCRHHLKSAYPRLRLASSIDPGPDSTAFKEEPIDLISVKLNKVYIVCAKQSRSNLVRLTVCDPERHNRRCFITRTKTWFAHGSQVRVSEKKFRELTDLRPDLKLLIVPQSEMMFKNARFNQESAFGYLSRQLTNLFKNIDSTNIQVGDLELVLDELQWRETYGKEPKSAFFNILVYLIPSISDNYDEESSLRSTQPSKGGSKSNTTPRSVSESVNSTKKDNSKLVWLEEYFYATTSTLVDSGLGYKESDEQVKLPLFMEMAFSNQENNLYICHLCHLLFDSMSFSFHVINHADHMINELTNRDNNIVDGQFECRHCFKTLDNTQLADHSILFKSDEVYKWSCRICCIKYSREDEFIQHMIQTHAKYETPYHCPKCKFASSFQRDVMIHFKKVHKRSTAVICPICLRSFTISQPESLTAFKILNFSRIFHNHILDHYEFSGVFACKKCCLSFVSNHKLRSHMEQCHMHVGDDGRKLIPYKVLPGNEEFCTKVKSEVLTDRTTECSPIYDEAPILLERSKRYQVHSYPENMDVSHVIEQPQIDNETQVNFEPDLEVIDVTEGSVNEWHQSSQTNGSSQESLNEPDNPRESGSCSNHHKRRYRQSKNYVTRCGLDYSGPYLEFDSNTMKLEKIITTVTIGGRISFVVKLENENKAHRIWPADLVSLDLNMVRDFLYQAADTYHEKKWSNLCAKLKLEATIFNEDISTEDIIETLRDIQMIQTSQCNSGKNKAR